MTLLIQRLEEVFKLLPKRTTTPKRVTRVSTSMRTKIKKKAHSLTPMIRMIFIEIMRTSSVILKVISEEAELGRTTSAET